jgi:hypothetical protein
MVVPDFKWLKMDKCKCAGFLMQKCAVRVRARRRDRTLQKGFNKLTSIFELKSST